MADAVLLARWSFRALVLSGLHWTREREGAKIERPPSPHGISIGARCFLVALDQHRSESSPQPFPSQDLLAAECGCSVDSIARFFREAKEAGWVERIDRGVTSHGRLAPAYNLLVPEAIIAAWEANSGGKAPRNLRKAYAADCGGGLPSNLRPYIDNSIEVTTNSKENTFNPPHRVGRKPQAGMGDAIFCDAMSAYPRRAGSNPRHLAYQKWNSRVADGEDPATMAAGVKRYAKFCRATRREGTEYVMQACRFFGSNREYDESWDAPPPGEGGHGSYVAPPPAAPREPMVSPQQLGDILQRAAGQAVPERRYLSNRKPHLLLRGTIYPFGADVPSALVSANLLMAECVIPAPPLPPKESTT